MEPSPEACMLATTSSGIRIKYFFYINFSICYKSRTLRETYVRIVWQVKGGTVITTSGVVAASRCPVAFWLTCLDGLPVLLYLVKNLLISDKRRSIRDHSRWNCSAHTTERHCSEHNVLQTLGYLNIRVARFSTVGLRMSRLVLLRPCRSTVYIERLLLNT